VIVSFDLYDARLSCDCHVITHLRGGKLLLPLGSMSQKSQIWRKVSVAILYWDCILAVINSVFCLKF